jgi:hypothetical protein
MGSEKRLGNKMKLQEIKNMNKNELIEYLDLYSIEAYPDESKRKLLAKAVDLFWATRENNGFSYETVEGTF